jgi:hypothetical protein
MHLIHHHSSFIPQGRHHRFVKAGLPLHLNQLGLDFSHHTAAFADDIVLFRQFRV